jgi:hypothetical protein
MSSFQINLLAAPTQPVVYSVVAAGSAYKGAIQVVILDVLGLVEYNGSLQSYTTTILQSRFPINITVTPAINY